MSKVQSTLTYTVAANGCSTVVPKPPLNCGCDDFLLILKDRSLLQSDLHGVLHTRIISLTISSAPVPYTDPSTGITSNVWRFDYVVEYDTDDLSDVDYRVRRCDLAYNCCYSCSHAFTERLLEGYVQTVEGCGVSNVDPQNPVINPRTCFDGLSTATIDYDYNVTTGVHSANVVVSADENNVLEARESGLYVPEPEFSTSNTCALGGVGANYAIKSITRIGLNEFRINSAAEHTSVINAGGRADVAGVPFAAVGNLSVAPYVLITGNPSLCRPMNFMGTTYNNFERVIDGPTQINWGVNLGVNAPAIQHLFNEDARNPIAIEYAGVLSYNIPFALQVAAGGILTVSIQNFVSVLVPNAASSWNTSFMYVSVHGTTV